MAEIRDGRVMLTVSEEELTELETGRASGSGRAVVVSDSGRGLFGGWRRTGSFRNVRSFSSPRSVIWNGGFGRFFCDPQFEDDGRSHFLDACALCKKPLGGHRDIFMYRGDTPFCSEECRQEQIDMDEAKENNLSNLAMKASSRKGRNTNIFQRSIHVQATGAIVAGLRKRCNPPFTTKKTSRLSRLG